MSSLDASLELSPEETAESLEAIKRRQEGLAKRLANLRPQRKGEPSRNPRGRPKKDYDLAKEAQKHARAAIQALAECVQDRKASYQARISAAGELLDRGFGKAPQSLDVKHTMTIGEEFDRFVRALQGLDQRELPSDNREARVIEHDPREAEAAVVDLAADPRQ